MSRLGRRGATALTLVIAWCAGAADAAGQQTFSGMAEKSIWQASVDVSQCINLGADEIVTGDRVVRIGPDRLKPVDWPGQAPNFTAFQFGLHAGSPHSFRVGAWKNLGGETRRIGIGEAPQATVKDNLRGELVPVLIADGSSRFLILAGDDATLVPMCAEASSRDARTLLSAFPDRYPTVKIEPADKAANLGPLIESENFSGPIIQPAIEKADFQRDSRPSLGDLWKLYAERGRKDPFSMLPLDTDVVFSFYSEDLPEAFEGLSVPAPRYPHPPETDMLDAMIVTDRCAARSEKGYTAQAWPEPKEFDRFRFVLHTGDRHSFRDRSWDNVGREAERDVTLEADNLRAQVILELRAAGAPEDVAAFYPTVILGEGADWIYRPLCDPDERLPQPSLYPTVRANFKQPKVDLEKVDVGTFSPLFADGDAEIPQAEATLKDYWDQFLVEPRRPLLGVAGLEEWRMEAYPEARRILVDGGTSVDDEADAKPIVVSVDQRGGDAASSETSIDDVERESGEEQSSPENAVAAPSEIDESGARRMSMPFVGLPRILGQSFPLDAIEAGECDVEADDSGEGVWVDCGERMPPHELRIVGFEPLAFRRPFMEIRVDDLQVSTGELTIVYAHMDWRKRGENCLAEGGPVCPTASTKPRERKKLSLRDLIAGVTLPVGDVFGVDPGACSVSFQVEGPGSLRGPRPDWQIGKTNCAVITLQHDRRVYRDLRNCLPISDAAAPDQCVVRTGEAPRAYLDSPGGGLPSGYFSPWSIGLLEETWGAQLLQEATLPRPTSRATGAIRRLVIEWPSDLRQGAEVWLFPGQGACDGQPGLVVPFPESGVLNLEGDSLEGPLAARVVRNTSERPISACAPAQSAPGDGGIAVLSFRPYSAARRVIVAVRTSDAEESGPLRDVINTAVPTWLHRRDRGAPPFSIVLVGDSGSDEIASSEEYEVLPRRASAGAVRALLRDASFGGQSAGAGRALSALEEWQRDAPSAAIVYFVTLDSRPIGSSEQNLLGAWSDHGTPVHVVTPSGCDRGWTRRPKPMHGSCTEIDPGLLGRVVSAEMAARNVVELLETVDFAAMEKQ